MIIFPCGGAMWYGIFPHQKETVGSTPTIPTRKSDYLYYPLDYIFKKEYTVIT